MGAALRREQVRVPGRAAAPAETQPPPGAVDYARRRVSARTPDDDPGPDRGDP